MILRISCITLLVSLPFALRGAEDAPRTRMQDLLRARIAEDAKKAEAKKSAPVATLPSAKNEELPEKTGQETGTSGGSAKKSSVTKKASEATNKESPTVLPKMEVKKSRITELDQKLAKQEQDIARERKNLRASEVDTALNDSKIARPLAIFGGESTQFRQHVASERVELMETEKDLIEAIARAKTKEEKQALQKQLDELKAVRRELEKSLR